MNMDMASRIAEILAEHGVEQAPEDIAGLVAGLAAAPDGLDRQQKFKVLPTDLPRAVLDRLMILADEMAAAIEQDISDRSRSADRIADLRAWMAASEIDGFIVPRSDEHFGEWVPARTERLCWLTGFSGSAGMAIVLAERGAIFVDGRYTLQVRDQVDTDLLETLHITDEPATGWLRQALPAGARLGYDPWLHTKSGLRALEKACRDAGAHLVAVAENPVDAIWHDQPSIPLAPVQPHDMKYAGRTSADKRAELADALKQAGHSAAVLSQPDSIAWLLNIRGADVPRTPLPLGFAVLHDTGLVDLYMDDRKILDQTRTHLGNEVMIRPPAELGAGLAGLGSQGQKVLVDALTCVRWITDRLAEGGAEVVNGSDPCSLPRALKNDTEMAGTRDAHIRDGVAMVRFLRWLDENAPTGDVTESEAAAKLQAFRAEDVLIRDLSFDTISGSGPNGAIVHYRVSPETDRTLQPGELFLLDSGAQYLDGTTDITRTMPVGDPDDEMRERFTLVLKGHIALATARFPAGTTGTQLDTLARAPLWSAGLDYDHGTGHGVGSFLGVHEGPHRISKMPSRIALQPGMIISNEPGYYKTGAYGIRVENLILVRGADVQGDRETLEFETLTVAPIDRRLVVAEMLTSRERDWLNVYHARVQTTLLPLLSDPADRSWLEQATKTV